MSEWLDVAADDCLPFTCSKEHVKLRAEVFDRFYANDRGVLTLYQVMLAVSDWLQDDKDDIAVKDIVSEAYKSVKGLGVSAEVKRTDLVTRWEFRTVLQKIYTGRTARHNEANGASDVHTKKKLNTKAYPLTFATPCVSPSSSPCATPVAQTGVQSKFLLPTFTSAAPPAQQNFMHPTFSLNFDIPMATTTVADVAAPCTATVLPLSPLVFDIPVVSSPLVSPLTSPASSPTQTSCSASPVSFSLAPSTLSADCHSSDECTTATPESEDSTPPPSPTHIGAPPAGLEWDEITARLPHSRSAQHEEERGALFTRFADASTARLSLDGVLAAVNARAYLRGEDERYVALAIEHAFRNTRGLPPSYSVGATDCVTPAEFRAVLQTLRRGRIFARHGSVSLAATRFGSFGSMKKVASSPLSAQLRTPSVSPQFSMRTTSPQRQQRAVGVSPQRSTSPSTARGVPRAFSLNLASVRNAAKIEFGCATASSPRVTWDDITARLPYSRSKKDSLRITAGLSKLGTLNESYKRTITIAEAEVAVRRFVKDTHGFDLTAPIEGAFRSMRSLPDTHVVQRTEVLTRREFRVLLQELRRGRVLKRTGSYGLTPRLSGPATARLNTARPLTARPQTARRG